MKRDVAVGNVKSSSKSIGTNTVNTKTINEAIFSKGELDEIVDLAIEEYELQRNKIVEKNLVSVGTQMLPESIRAIMLVLKLLRKGFLSIMLECP